MKRSRLRPSGEPWPNRTKDKIRQSLLNYIRLVNLLVLDSDAWTGALALYAQSDTTGPLKQYFENLALMRTAFYRPMTKMVEQFRNENHEMAGIMQIFEIVFRRTLMNTKTDEPWQRMNMIHDRWMDLEKQKRRGFDAFRFMASADDFHTHFFEMRAGFEGILAELRSVDPARFSGDGQHDFERLMATGERLSKFLNKITQTGYDFNAVEKKPVDIFEFLQASLDVFRQQSKVHLEEKFDPRLRKCASIPTGWTMYFTISLKMPSMPW